MELISKEVVKRIIDSERTREQMIGMVESAVTFEECDDCISRESAIDAIRKDIMGGLNYEGILARLPSVSPKERTGHWIAVYQGDEIINYRCSECEFGNTFGKNTDGLYYCPRCGARMTGSR